MSAPVGEVEWALLPATATTDDVFFVPHVSDTAFVPPVPDRAYVPGPHRPARRNP